MKKSCYLAAEFIGQAALREKNSVMRDLMNLANGGGNSTNQNNNSSSSGSGQNMNNNTSLKKFLELVEQDENTFYIPECLCKKDDFKYFEALESEMDFKPMWLTGGTKLVRPAVRATQALFDEKEIYSEIVRRLVVQFKISNPIRGIINHYRNENDSTAFHRDVYPEGTNFTCGVSFGNEREIEFIAEDEFQMLGADAYSATQSGSKFSFPQRNGDIFAFSDFVNRRFRHGVPRGRGKVGGRISLVLWGNRKGKSEIKGGGGGQKTSNKPQQQPGKGNNSSTNSTIPDDSSSEKTHSWDYEIPFRENPNGFRVLILEKR